LAGAVVGALMLAFTWNKTTPALSAKTSSV